MPVIDPDLLEILACPADRGPLMLVDGRSEDPFLYNHRLRKAYRIDDGIPVLLVDEAWDVSAEEHESILARADSPDAG